MKGIGEYCDTERIDSSVLTTYKVHRSIRPTVTYTGKFSHKDAFAVAEGRDGGRICTIDIDVEYKPKRRIIDEESLDSYLTTFKRSTLVGEEAIVRIYNDLEDVLFPPSSSDDNLYIQLAYQGSIPGEVKKVVRLGGVL